MDDGNFDNQTAMYADLGQAFDAIGSNWYWDAVYLFITPLISSFGFSTNILSAYVFAKCQFKSLRLYSLMQSLTLNSALICFFTMFDFVFYSKRFLWIANTPVAIIWSCYIHEPITSVAYFCGSLLNIIIMIDRLAAFSKKFTIFPKTWKACQISAAVFVICATLSIPYYLVQRPTDELVRIRSEHRLVRLYFYHESDFSKTTLGRALTYTVYLVRDVLTMAVIIFLTLLYIVRIKQHFSQHWNRVSIASIREVGAAELSPSNTTTIAKKSSIMAFSQDGQSIFDHKIDRKAKFIISLCALEIVEHVVIVASIFYGNFYNNWSGDLLYRLADLFVILRNAVNFPMFSLTNKHFKDYLVKRWLKFTRL